MSQDNQTYSMYRITNDAACGHITIQITLSKDEAAAVDAVFKGLNKRGAKLSITELDSSGFLIPM